MAAPTNETTNVLSFASTNATTRKLFVNRVVYISGASGVAGDTCVLKDAAGVTRLTIGIDAAKETKDVDLNPGGLPCGGLYCDGLTVTTSHGTAEVHLD